MLNSSSLPVGQIGPKLHTWTFKERSSTGSLEHSRSASITLHQLSYFNRQLTLHSPKHLLLFQPHVSVLILHLYGVLLVQFLTSSLPLSRSTSNPVSPESLFCPSQHEVISASLNFCSTMCLKINDTKLCDSLVSSVQFSHSVVSDSLRPHGPTARQASLSITNSQSLPKVVIYCYVNLISIFYLSWDYLFGKQANGWIIVTYLYKLLESRDQGVFDIPQSTQASVFLIQSQ